MGDETAGPARTAAHDYREQDIGVAVPGYVADLNAVVAAVRKWPLVDDVPQRGLEPLPDEEALLG